ncbi:hypothetical protein IAT38_008460 [Cryptococcus sp. DSM 104549]
MAPRPQTRPRNNPIVSPPATLVVVLDIHPLSWSLLHSPPATESHQIRAINDASSASINLTEFVTILMVYLNAHLASRWGNEVVVYGATAGKATLLYPPHKISNLHSTKPKSNTYRPFQLLDVRIEEAMQEMIAEETKRLTSGDTDGLNEPPAMVSALTKALCFISRRIAATGAPSDATEAIPESLSTGPDKAETRILIINATPGSNVRNTSDGAEAGQGADQATGQGGQMRGGYVGLMNCVFAAQKSKVPIDVLTLPPPTIDASPPIFLQQASHLTDGVYWQWNGRGGLLQYLHSIYLIPASLRRKPFAVPPQDAVGFRAVCFCHHKTLDIGFVCSVCLSIFCQPKPVCLMCKTRFPVKSIPTLRTLSSFISSIPVPDTVITPDAPKRSNHGHHGHHGQHGKGKGKAVETNGAKGGAGEPIVID